MNLEISVEHDAWNKDIDIKSTATECVDAVFAELKLNHYNVEICFLFTNDDEMRMLNKTYRGVDKSTSVLSFPSNVQKEMLHDFVYCDDLGEDPLSGDDNSYCCCNACILGSIVFAHETAEYESKNQNKTMKDHLRHLIVHSVLHLLGYDHASDREAEQMEKLEIKILEKLNVANPYL
jgi:probable rRNA maturation factor